MSNDYVTLVETNEIVTKSEIFNDIFSNAVIYLNIPETGNRY